MTLCRNTRLNLVLMLALAAFYAVQASPAVAADVTATQSHSAADNRYSLELNPLPMLLLLSPGSGGLQGEFEVRMSPNISVFTEAYHLHLHLSDQTVANMQKDQDTPDGIPSDMETSGVAAGVRYYGNALADSWYVGAKFGGGTTHTDWAYADQRVQADTFGYTLGAEAGYRWMWDSGFLLRLGAGLGATDVTERSVSTLTATTSTSADALRNVDSKEPSNKPALAISYDLGLGYVF